MNSVVNPARWSSSDVGASAVCPGEYSIVMGGASELFGCDLLFASLPALAFDFNLVVLTLLLSIRANRM